MIKVYYSTLTICFGNRTELEQAGCTIIDSINQTKLQLFSESAKRVGIICEDAEFELRKFIVTFEVIEAGGGVVKNPEGDTLMIFRNGRWDLPKGKLEEGELIEDCALREVSEECAITGLTLGAFRTHTYHIYKLHGRYVLKRCWWWNMSHDGNCDLKPQVEEGITDVRWITPTDMPYCLNNTYYTIIDVIDAES